MSLVSGCNSERQARVACEAAPAPEFPQADASLTDANAGHTFCVHPGQTLSVTLHAAASNPDARWMPVASSDRVALEPMPNGALTLIRGVTATFLSARQPGTSRLSSSDPTGRTWTATVVVRG